MLLFYHKGGDEITSLIMKQYLTSGFSLELEFHKYWRSGWISGILPT